MQFSHRQIIREAVSRGEKHPSSFRPDIEGLRAVAVLLVIAFHFGFPGVQGGFIGVDVFFVVSGYLITGLLAKEASKTGTISLSNFYARRVRRLLPASALMLLVVIGVSYSVLGPLDQDDFSSTAIYTAGYLSNRYFAVTAFDYFGSGVVSNPLLHTWSLAVEEQFYLVWPVVMLIGCRLRRSQGALIGLLSLVTGLSLAACVQVIQLNQQAAFYLPHYRAWEFGVGGLAFFVPASSIQRVRRLGSVLAWTGMAGVLLSAAVYSGKTLFPGVSAVLPVLSTAALLISGTSETGSVRRFLELRVLQGIGRLSYSLYLWHWPVLVLGTALLGGLSVLDRILLVCAVLGLSILTTRLVENPIRFSSYLLARPAFSLGLAGLVTIVGLGTAFSWKTLVRNTPQYAVFASARNDMPRLYDGNCRVSVGETRPLECVFGAKEPNPAATVVLFGDSHAAQWFPALEEIAKQQRWKLVTFIKTSCPAVPVAVHNVLLGREEAQCSEWRELGLKRIVELRPSAVIIGSYSYYSVPGQPGSRVAEAAWTEATHRMLSQLTAAGIAVGVMRDTPHVGFDVPRCLAQVAWRGSGACDPALRSDALRGDILRAEQDASRGLDGAFLLDLTDDICDERRCELVREGSVVYRDENHLTATFAETLAAPLARRLVPKISARMVADDSALRMTSVR